MEGRSWLYIKCTPPTLVSFSSSPSLMSVKLCSMCVYQSVQFYRILSRIIQILYTRSILGRAVVGCPSNAHPKLWCLSAPRHHLCLLTLYHECASIRYRFRILLHNQQAKAQITHKSRTWEGHSRLFVKCTTASLVSISPSPSPLSAKLCFMSVYRSVTDFE